MDPAQLLQLPARVTRHEYSRRDTILYALGVGAGQDPIDPAELRFVYEDGLLALPSMAVVLAYPGFWLREPQYAVDWKRVLHVEQSVELHAPLPVEGIVRGETSVDRIIDKGCDKGALLYVTRRVVDESSGTLLATVKQVSLLRGDGGCGGSAGEPPPPRPIPDRAPDSQIVQTTRPEQALIYRLSGDYNPLHADPQVAKAAGLSRPILHGLCTFGIATRAILRALCANEPPRMKRIECRFTAPVLPGDRLAISIWRSARGRAAFQVRVPERDVLVLNNGYVEVDAD